MLSHPELPRCEDCQRFVFDDEWKPMLERDGKPQRRLGDPPCYRCPKLSKEDQKRRDVGPHLAAELSLSNLLAYQHYRKCKATHRFPNDPLVEQNAGIILGVEEDYTRVQQRISLQVLTTALKGR